MLLLRTLEDGQRREGTETAAESSEAAGEASGDAAALENNLAGPQTLRCRMTQKCHSWADTRADEQTRAHSMCARSSRQHSHDGQRRDDPDLRLKGDDKMGSSHIMAQGCVIKKEYVTNLRLSQKHCTPGYRGHSRRSGRV